MKVTQEKLPASQVCFNVEVEGEQSQAIYDRLVNNLVRSVQVPGFRKGKAPKQLVLRQVGSEQLKASVLEELLEKTLQQIIKDNEDLDAIGSFELQPPVDELIGQFALGQPLVFKALIDVQPEVKLNKHQGFSVKAEKVEPDLTEVDKTLNQYQVRNSTLVPVEDRGAELGDVVIIDLLLLDENRNKIEEGSAEDVQADMNEGEFIPDLIKNMVGMKVGETKEIALTLPEDYYLEDYAGQPATFIITLNDLKSRELPALDDEFAQSISEKSTMAELREFLEQRITEDAEEKTQENVEAAILKDLVSELEVDLPATLIKQEANFMVQQQAMFLQRSQKDDKLLKQLFTKEFINEMRRINEPEAINRIKRTLALAEVAKLENITADEAELAERIDQFQQALAGESVDPLHLRRAAEDELITEKVLEWLKEHSTVEFVPVGSLEPETDESEESLIAGDEEAVDEVATPASEATVSVEATAVEEAPATKTESKRKTKSSAKNDKTDTDSK